jgi:hypothetical protein
VAAGSERPVLMQHSFNPCEPRCASLLTMEASNVLAASLALLLFTPPEPPSEESFGWHYTARTDDFASHLLYYPDERLVIIWANNDRSKRWRQTLNDAITEIVFSASEGDAPAARF